MKKILMIIAALALAGCAHKPAPVSSDFVAYVPALRHAVESQIQLADRWEGKKCTVRIRASSAGGVESVRAEGGNPELCAYLVKTLAGVTLPKATPAVYAQVSAAKLDFAL